MNHEENKPEMQPWIEPELEARVIAWVSGEASAFEVAELERVVGEKPELGIFKRRLEAVQGLVQTAVRPDAQPLKLSPERRAKLLSVIGTPKQPPSSGGPGGGGSERATTGSSPLVFPVRKRRAIWQRMLTIAAGLMIGLSIPAAFRLAEFKNRAPMELFEREAWVTKERGSRERYVALEAPAVKEEMDASAPTLAVAAPPLAASVEPLGEAARDPNSRLFGAGTPSGIASADAQRASDFAEGTVVMDKFEVKEDAPTAGYAASSTLAGTRVQLPKLELNQSLAAGFPDQAAKLKQSANGAEGAARKKVFGTQPSNGAVGQTFHYGSYGSPRPAAAKGSSENGTPQFDYYNAPSSQAKTLAKSSTESRASGGKQPVPVADASGQIASANVDEKLVVLDAFSVSSDKKAALRSRNGNAARRVASTQALGKPIRPTPSDTVLGQGAAQPRQEAAAVANNQVLKDIAASSTLSRLDLTTAEPADALKAQVAPAKPAEPNNLRAETNTAAEPVSTFSLHVSDVSFRLAQNALAQGRLPAADSVRPEEFYNALKYADPAPAFTDKVVCRVEQAAHPFLQQRNLVRVAMKVASAGRGVTQPLRLTVLLDTSGSMEREDRSASVQRALGVLTSLLGPNDRISLIGFARQPRLLADQLSGERAQTLPQVVQNTPAEGGTNLEAALKLASEVANRQKDPQAQNRIVLLTDGAANLGNAVPSALASQVENLRQQGIAFDACGVGLEGIDDDMLEALTRKGDGRYYVLNTPEAADTDFAQQLAGAFRPAAQNVKVQVRFNPARVGNYRLIGFEKHRLKEEDFRNDKVDAAELAADEAAVALYQIEAKPDGQGELGEVYVRFRDAATGNMVERSWTLPYEAQPASFDRASSNLQLAGLAALIAEKMRGGAEGDPIHLADLAPVANQLRGQFPSDARVQELVAMYNQLRALGTP